MQTRGKIYSKGKFLLSLAATSALLLLIGSTSASAAVTGQCVNCHTMHNSQDGASVAAGSTATLLSTDCVGCHSSTGTSTIVNIAGSNYPIVWNTAYPAQPLAGGNFARTATDSNYGHNVRGIATAETGAMAQAPGGSGTGCADSCHTSLTLADIDTATPTEGGDHFNGCQGCHTRTSHHNSADPSYRFLGGHRSLSPMRGDVLGTEASDWEQVASNTNHNIYRTPGDVPLQFDLSIGEFCAGCHSMFHATGTDTLYHSPNINGGSVDASISSPWLRHPSDVNLPLGFGEYAAMSGIAYEPLVPVAQLSTGDPNTIDAGDQVTCLSCHRAHGSNFPDSLRWDYNNINAHSYVGGSNEGCFFCHTSKDTP